MRFLTFLVIGLLIVDVASSQTIVTSRTPSAAPPPKYQPVLLGKGPNSLVDQIDTAALIAKGQKDAAVMFYSITDKTGSRARRRILDGSRHLAGVEVANSQTRPNLACSSLFFDLITHFTEVREAGVLAHLLFIRGVPDIKSVALERPKILENESHRAAPDDGVPQTR